MGSRRSDPKRAKTGYIDSLRRAPFWIGLAFVVMGIVSQPIQVAQAADPPQEPLSHFPTADIQVESGNLTHSFKVWISATPERHEQGLMYVKHLDPRRGMLFLFDTPYLASFWMKNTYIPLDLLFIAPDGRVIRIAENATPLSLEPISAMGTTLGVLELAGGTCSKLGIKPGARVRHPQFEPH
jgi:uncharacterized protein